MKKGKLQLQLQQGFTLLELLVTISIIGILIAVGSVSFSTAQRKGRDSRRMADAKAIQKALEECYALDSAYPASITYGSALACAVSTETVMGQVPRDPKPALSYTYSVDAGVAKSSYCLCALLENLGTGNADSAGAAGVCVFDNDGVGNNYFCVSNQQ